MNVTCVIDVIENEGCDFIILTRDKGLLGLFSDLYGHESVIQLPQLFTNFSNLKLFISDYLKLQETKNNLLKKIQFLEPTKIIFFYLGWNGFESWLIKKLSSNSVVYYRPKVNIDMVKSNWSIKAIIKTYIVSIIYGIRFKSSLFYGYPMITIDRSFLKLVKARKYEHAFDAKNVNTLISKKFSELRSVKVLLLVGGEYNVNIDEYRKKLSEMYSVITRYYDPQQIGIKNHPSFQNIKLEFSTDCVVLPDKTPANLLCYMSTVIIGYGSATLYEAADIGKTAISIIYMVPSTKHGQANNTSKYLLENSVTKNILFPKDFDEFNCILM